MRKYSENTEFMCWHNIIYNSEVLHLLAPKNELYRGWGVEGMDVKADLWTSKLVVDLYQVSTNRLHKPFLGSISWWLAANLSSILSCRSAVELMTTPGFRCYLSFLRMAEHLGGLFQGVFTIFQLSWVFIQKAMVHSFSNSRRIREVTWAQTTSLPCLKKGMSTKVFQMAKKTGVCMFFISSPLHPLWLMQARNVGAEGKPGPSQWVLLMERQSWIVLSTDANSLFLHVRRDPYRALASRPRHTAVSQLEPDFSRSCLEQAKRRALGERENILSANALFPQSHDKQGAKLRRKRRVPPNAQSGCISVGENPEFPSLFRMASSCYVKYGQG